MSLESWWRGSRENRGESPYPKKVDFPTSASPKSKIVTSGGSAIFKIHFQQILEDFKPLMSTKKELHDKDHVLIRNDWLKKID